MKMRRGLILLLALFLIGCTSNAATEDTEQASADETAETAETEQTADGKVVTIQDKTFDDDDLEFYTLMNKLKLILEMNEAESDDQTEYLEEQQTYYDNVNVNLQSMIELYAMSLLAEEKNYFVPDEKLQKLVKEFKEKVEKVEEATALIETFGEKKFNRNIEEYIRQTTLRDRIAGELKEEIEEENPDAIKDEILYMLEEKFEDLLMDQIYSLEMDIHIK